VSARIRLASEGDAEAALAIYAPYVRETAISFEVEPPSVDEFARRIATVLAETPWLLCESGGRVVGYAYAGKFHTRAAYRWTVETTVYVDRDHHRRGIGHALYTSLLACLRLQGFGGAVGIIALPNAGSVGLHERMGFVRAGVLPAVGWKHGRWHDVGWWRLGLDAVASADPPPPRPIGALSGTPAWDAALASGLPHLGRR